MDFKRLFTNIPQNLYRSFLHLVYPTRCLYCHILLAPDSVVLCPGCASLLSLICPEERCPGCFNLLAEDCITICKRCSEYPSHYYRVAAAFDYEGPPVALVKRLKYGNQPYLAQGMAGFLVAQLDCLQWPLPDALIPVPLSFSHWLDRGYNQSALLAEEMARLLNRPVWYPLSRQSGDVSQASLTLEQRKNLAGKSFKCSSTWDLKGKRLLIIDDVMTSGLTLQHCAEKLVEANPTVLYALTFCRAMQ